VKAIRIMTYNIHRGRGRDGRVDVDRIQQVIGEGAPDLVALQELDQAPDPCQLTRLGDGLGMRSFGNPVCGGNGFLSYVPLRGVHTFDLGDGGSCLRVDADFGGGRLHLFNLRLCPSSPQSRARQITKLLGPDLLGSPSISCPVLVLGDFADWWWGSGNLSLNLLLRKARLPFWNATYPTPFPIVGRDRAYLRGEVRVVDATILRSRQARHASLHLPLILTVQVTDPRSYLKVEKLNSNRMRIAPG
jgi:endonuclease/exonuclease/phosphatase family metal-dependent hydrolase